MVSQPDHSSLSGSGISSGSTTLLNLRGAAKSVVGTASTTGHHRHRASSSRRDHHDRRHYNRSYAGGGGGGGGSAYAPQNEFPWFGQSGDVEIVVKVPGGHANRYLLHRHTLTRCSGFFEASTSEPWSRAKELPGPVVPGAAASTITTAAATPSGGTELARLGGEDLLGATAGAVARIGTPRKRWRYELDCGAGGDDVPMLVQKEESGAAGGPTPPVPAGPTSIFGGSTSGSVVSAATAAGGRKHASSHRPASSRDFFRSVANLPLSSSASAAGGGGGYSYSYPPPNPAAANLPPPTPDEQDILRDYDNLFRIMYNHPPVLDGINIADAYVQCKSLLTLADQYDALAVVGPRVDHHLLQFQSRLWKQIAKYPISYLRLGYLARSRIIFQEALIHVVGQWPAGERSLRSTMPEAVLDIIEDKVDELEETVARVEGRLFRLNLTTRSGERVSPATGYLDWLAVSLFRQWLADNTTPAPTPPHPPGARGGATSRQSRTSASGATTGAHSTALVSVRGGVPGGLAVPVIPPLSSLGRTYRTLGHPTGAGFLGRDECKRFLKLTPDLYSRENLRRFEKRVDELKALAREVVRPLMGSGLELDLAGGSCAAEAIGYLTCTRVGDRDLPWG